MTDEHHDAADRDEPASGMPAGAPEPEPLGVPEAEPDRDAPEDPEVEDLPGIAADGEPPASS